MIRVLAFYESALVKGLSALEIAALVLVSAVVAAAPIGASPPFLTLVGQVAFFAVGFAVILAMLFRAHQALGGKTPAADFIGGLSVAVAVTSAASLALSLLTLQVDTYFGSQIASSVAFSLLPFYPLVAIGWAVDALANLETARGIALGLFAVLVLTLLQFGLEYATVLLG